MNNASTDRINDSIDASPARSTARRAWWCTLVVFSVLSCLIPLSSAWSGVVTYSGQATGFQSTLAGVTTTIAQTDPLPSAGGTKSVSVASAAVPGLVSLGAMNGSTTGSGNQSQSTMSVSTLGLTVGGNTITAGILTSTATVTCGANGPTTSGSSQVANLVVNGTAVQVNGSPNQTIALPNGAGQIVINEQHSSINGSTAEMNVTALHIIVIGVADVAISSSHADINCNTPANCSPRISFSGQATVVKASVLGVQTVIGDTGPLPESGGSRETTLVAANVPGLLGATALSGSTHGSGNESQSNASVESTNLTVGGHAVTADLLSSSATTTCVNGKPLDSGSSLVLNLKVDGKTINVSGAPNQKVLLPNGAGYVVINEQDRSTVGGVRSITVNAVRVVVTGVADVAIASSHADISCTVPSKTYSGQATVLATNIAGIRNTASDTGPLPSTGGTLQSGLPTVNMPGLLTAQLLSASTTGSGNQSQSTASVKSVNLTAEGNTITADVLQSTATATCATTHPSVSGSSVVTNLVINGTSIVVSGAPNQTILLPGGTGQVIINEQISSINGTTGQITVNALHVNVGGTTDVVISSSHADITCAALPACPVVLPAGPCPTCQIDAFGAPVTVTVNQNVTVDFNVNPPKCMGDLDLCSFFTFDKSGATPDKWRAIFDIGGRKLLVKSGATITAKGIGSGGQRFAPGMDFLACEIEVEKGGTINVTSINKQAGNIFMQACGNAAINGVVSNEGSGPVGIPGEIAITACTGDLTTGPNSVVQTIGHDAGGADINLLACCGPGRNIEIRGLVDANYHEVIRPTISIAAMQGSVTIYGSHAPGGSVLGGVSVRPRTKPEPGKIKIQARQDVVVIGNPTADGLGAVSTHNEFIGSVGGTIEVVALEGGIFGSDRAFDNANRYNGAAEISLLAHGNIGLSVTSGPMVVVTTQGLSFNDAEGGTNRLQSTAGSIFIGSGAQVMANFTGGNGTNGTNLLTACGGVFNSGTVNPADANPADDSGVCLVPLPTPLFPDCQSVESRVDCGC